MDEYQNDRWRIIAGKVGNGFTPAACREKGLELELENQHQEQQHEEDPDQHEEEEDEENGE